MHKMFENLLDFSPEPSNGTGFVPLKKVSPKTLLAAQQASADWLEELGAPSDAEIDIKQEKSDAREAFTALNFDPDEPAQVTALATIKTPAALQHLTGMLSAYDWDFIGKAKELRTYAVSKIVEETKHPDARIRLKALQMLGNVTEVALFTTRMEVTQKDASEEELETRLRERLSRFVTPSDGATVTDVTPVAPTPKQDTEIGLDEEIARVVEHRQPS